MRDTIDMAREAGIRDCTCNGTLGCLERFADLARADEREACAKVCEDDASTPEEQICAAAIRARGNT
jgi:ferredoxin